MIDMLRRYVRRWTTTIGSSATAPPDDHARAAAQQARGNRASEVTRLHHEVRELQQRITNVSAAQDQSVDAQKDTPQGGELAALYRELAHKQRELAKLQARI